ncbi:MAG: helix-turn-helix domain-containing protein [Pseudonocardiales bacterium]|nr:helix-turn-helix domain-containing protein [Pseudonocardiales bacterium]
MDTEEDHIWLPGLVPAIVHRLPAILTEVRDLLAEQQPDYAGFLSDAFTEILSAAEGFIARLVALAEQDPQAATPQLASGVEQALFEEIGRLHYEQQHDVTPLLAAYRTGAAVAWRHVAEEALEFNVPAEALAGLAAAVFAAVDQLSSASWRGYVQAQTTAGQARERLREELAELLLSDRADTAALRAAAARAEWPLPRQAAVILIEPDNEVGRALLERLNHSCLRLRRPTMLVAIVADPEGPGVRQRLRTALRGAGAVVGTTGPLEGLPASMNLAEHAVRLQRAGVLPEDPLFVDEHLDAMVVHRDDRLLAALRRQYLAPLAALSEGTRDRLVETLTSWLMNMGNRKAVAQQLHVHPQTVRYRLTQLREIFGSTLEDPTARAALLLALAWGPAITESDPLAPRPESGSHR